MDVSVSGFPKGIGMKRGISTSRAPRGRTAFPVHQASCLSSASAQFRRREFGAADESAQALKHCSQMSTSPAHVPCDVGVVLLLVDVHLTVLPDFDGAIAVL